MEGGKKVSLHRFLADQKIASAYNFLIIKNGAYYSTSNKVLLIARHVMTTGL